VHAYIPQGVWYQFPSGVKVNVTGVFTDLAAPMEKINVHVRGGFIIPMQIPGPNLMVGRGNPFTLLVAQSASGNATGNLFWDDGDTIGERSLGNNTTHTYPFSISFRFGRRKTLQLLGISTASGE
jgi:alpha-glucosidase (family GH31 glycosyl hydrolase)